MRRTSTGRGLIAAVVMMLAVLAGSVTPASATTGPNGFPILNASSGGVAHHCEVLGTSPSFYQAIVCVDINTASSSTGYSATGTVEAFCQDVNPDHILQTVQCKTIGVDGIFANGDTTEDFDNFCTSNCPAGRFEWSAGTPFTYTGGHDCTSSPGHDVWTVAVWDTRIVTPDNDPFTVGATGSNDSGNYSSGHYWICP